MSIRNDIFDAVLSAVEGIKDNADYDSNVRNVEPFRSNYLQAQTSETPMLMVIDQANDQVLVQDTTHTRYAFDVFIYGYYAGLTGLKCRKSSMRSMRI